MFSCRYEDGEIASELVTQVPGLARQRFLINPKAEVAKIFEEEIWQRSTQKCAAIVGHFQLFMGKDGVLHSAVGDYPDSIVNTEIIRTFFDSSVVPTFQWGTTFLEHEVAQSILLVADDMRFTHRQKVSEEKAATLRSNYYAAKPLPEQFAAWETKFEQLGRGVIVHSEHELTLSAFAQVETFPKDIFWASHCAQKAYLLLKSLSELGYTEVIVFLPWGCVDRAAIAGAIAVREGLLSKVAWGSWGSGLDGCSIENVTDTTRAVCVDIFERQ